MWEETISITGPYNFDEVIDRLEIDPLHVLDKQKRLVKVPILIGGERQVVEVIATGTTDEPSFVIKGSEYKDAAIERIKEIFQWKIPLTDVHRHFQNTTLKQLFSEQYGTPLVLEFSPYGCLLKCIIHQQLNMAFAHTLSKRFVETFGVEKDGVWFYPSPEVVANITVEQLRELQFSGRKAEYVIGVGREIVEGRLQLETFPNMSDQEIFDQLIKLRGVGPWTIQNFLLFGLGRPNLFPTADIGIQNALKKYFKMDRKPTLDEMETFKQGWDPYLSYASLYLWRSIE
jgi:DNA-3-methyladenine glycosylase II